MNRVVPDAEFCGHCKGPVEPSKGKKPRRYCSKKCRDTASKLRYRERHPDRIKKADKEYARRYYRNNWAEIRKRERMRRFGLTEDELLALYDRAAGCCEVCGTEFGHTPATREHIDHCHATGEVRGLLCAPCNLALGNAKDNPQRLRALADYLETHSA